jgi:hypothetical protein
VLSAADIYSREGVKLWIWCINRVWAPRQVDSSPLDRGGTAPSGTWPCAQTSLIHHMWFESDCGLTARSSSRSGLGCQVDGPVGSMYLPDGLRERQVHLLWESGITKRTLHASVGWKESEGRRGIARSQDFWRCIVKRKKLLMFHRKPRLCATWVLRYINLLFWFYMKDLERLLGEITTSTFTAFGFAPVEWSTMAPATKESSGDWDLRD